MKIALLVHTVSEWSRNVLLGVTQYGDEAGNWKYDVIPADNNGEAMLPEGWEGDGIICRLTSHRLRDRILESKLPCVNVSWLDSHSQEIPKVVSCAATCAQHSIDFLTEKQFRSFGYFGFHPSLNYSSEFEDTIKQQLAVHDMSLSVFKFPADEKGIETLSLTLLEAWINSLQKPVAIIAWTSLAGQKITLACDSLKIKVPNDVSILCLEHDRLFSAMAPIPLTNIDQDPWRVGYKAAALLHELIQGKPTPDSAIKIPPISVVPRISTEATAVSDPCLAQAIRFIYDNARKGIVVKDVVGHAGISRRALENKFKTQLKCTPANYIRKIQLQCVARLLRTTSLTVTDIAYKTGFNYPEIMMRTFKKEYGMTPLEFRQSGSKPTQ